MRAKLIVGYTVVGVLLAFIATAFVFGGRPMNKDDVGRVMLAHAMANIEIAIGKGHEVNQVNCSSKGDGKVICIAIGSGVSQVSFAGATGSPAFELAGQRGIDGTLYVNAFNHVPAEIPAREVDRFISAFDGRATVQAD